VFPHSRAIEEGDVEEERRLFYVGMTRARERLVLSYAQHRMLYGATQRRRPSRFLAEIPDELVERIGAVPAVRAAAAAHGGPLERGRPSPAPQAPDEPFVDYSFAQEPASGTPRFRIGTRVMHPKFGAGVVRRCEGTGEQTKLTVQFQRAGIKKLIARFAPLEVVP